jgi:cell division protein FtsN
MLRTSDSETEILLGNKQLFGIFVLVAILLGVAFAGGYMVGKNGRKAVPGTAETAAATPETNATKATGGETHSVTPEATANDHNPAASTATAPQDMSSSEPGSTDTEPPLGSPKRKAAADRTHVAETGTSTTSGEPAPSASTAEGEAFAPQVGQQFLQVAAVGRDEAEAVADVLHKKGFRAHAVPKPGSTKLYRVIVGPIRDAGDLSSTRDALMRTGFREVIVQRY